MMTLFIGTYTSEGAEGIYESTFDTETGTLSEPRCIAKAAQPSYVALHPRGLPFLYAVNELAGPDGKSGGAVSSFSRSVETGLLTLINSRPSAGKGPCHVSCHPGGTWVGVANYASGTAAVFPVGTDGALGEASSVVTHPELPGPGGVKSPHAHNFAFDASGRWAFVADLGLDRLMIYRFDQDRGILHPHDPASISAKPGAGPRALSLFPDGRRACLVNELDSTLALLDLDPERAATRVLETKSTLPPGWSGSNSCADVHVHPGGRFVFCSNRGHDSIAAFAVDGNRLAFLGCQPTGGKTPRSFCLDPGGRWLLAANQHTHDITCFRIDQSTGALSPVGSPLSVPAPVCLKLAPDR